MGLQFSRHTYPSHEEIQARVLEACGLAVDQIVDFRDEDNRMSRVATSYQRNDYTTICAAAALERAKIGDYIVAEKVLAVVQPVVGTGE
jgi:hypothetical protein